MKITIITVSYNSVKTIQRCIESVINQDCLDIEYIIIDGGSDDGTVDIIKKYESQLSYWHTQADDGIYDAMNKGISMATGDLLGIINSDDWYAPGVLKKICEQFLKNPNAVIHGDMMIVDENGRSLYSLHAPDLPSIQREFRKMTVNHPATFIPMNLYKNYGVFNLSYQLSADYELIIRLLSQGVPFVPLHEVTSYFSLGGQSGGLKTYKENFAIQRKYGRSLIGASGWFVKALVKLWISQCLPAPVLAFTKNLKTRLVEK